MMSCGEIWPLSSGRSTPARPNRPPIRPSSRLIVFFTGADVGRRYRCGGGTALPAQLADRVTGMLIRLARSEQVVLLLGDRLAGAGVVRRHGATTRLVELQPLAEIGLVAFEFGRGRLRSLLPLLG